MGGLALARHKASGPKVHPSSSSAPSLATSPALQMPGLPPAAATADPGGSRPHSSGSTGGGSGFSTPRSSASLVKHTPSPGSSDVVKSGVSSQQGDWAEGGGLGGAGASSAVEYGSLAWDTTLPSDLADLLRKAAAAGKEGRGACWRGGRQQPTACTNWFSGHSSRSMHKLLNGVREHVMQ